MVLRQREIQSLKGIAGAAGALVADGYADAQEQVLGLSDGTEHGKRGLRLAQARPLPGASRA